MTLNVVAGRRVRFNFTFFFSFSANCVKGEGRFYQGKQNKTHGGLECQEWFTTEPHVQTMPKGIFPEMNLAKNYCRNPGGTEPSPWCYTKDPLIRWQHCQIDKCGKKALQMGIYARRLFPWYEKVHFSDIILQKPISRKIKSESIY